MNFKRKKNDKKSYIECRKDYYHLVSFEKRTKDSSKCSTYDMYKDVQRH